MTTLNYSLASGSHDTKESDDGSISDSATTINPDADDEYGLLWFDNIAVANATTLDSATLTVNHTSGSDLNAAEVFCDDSDDSATPSTSNSDISNRTRTTAKTFFGKAGSGDKAYDVLALVQEVINRGGWSSGNAIGFIIQGADPSNDDATFNTYEGGQVAELEIVYTGGGSSSGLPDRRHVRGARRGVIRGCVG